MTTTTERPVHIPGMPLYPASAEARMEYWGASLLSTLYRLYRSLRALADVAFFTPAQPFWKAQVEYDVACMEQSVRNLSVALEDFAVRHR